MLSHFSPPVHPVSSILYPSFISTISVFSLPLLFSTLASFTSVPVPSVQRARRCSLFPARLTAPIQRNANSLQLDPVSLQCYPNRAVQPSWNQHHECFRHSYWDISIFIVRNHPYFTSPSPAAPITLCWVSFYFGSHIYTVFQSERRSTEGPDMMPLEEVHWVWTSIMMCNTFHFWQHFNSSETNCFGENRF